VDDSWTLPELVTEVAARLARLPEPKNGQVRAVPDERTVRYYGTIGLLARPIAMRGRTALYGHRHLAQVVAIKRMQSAGRSLAEITALWPTLDDLALQRMSGVELPKTKREFWKQRPETRIELAHGVHLALDLPEGVALEPADIHAIRAAAASLIGELGKLTQEKGT
jgi:DNA-binding transcriptional MerR regulator